MAKIINKNKMKKIFLTLASFAVVAIAGAQTVGDKSTEVGYDLGQKILDSGVKIRVEQSADSTFICYKVEGAIPADNMQRGSTQNFYYYCSMAHDSTLTESSTKAEIEASFKNWLSLQPYTEKPIENIYTVKE
jgi:hypothetical protein